MEQSSGRDTPTSKLKSQSKSIKLQTPPGSSIVSIHLSLINTVPNMSVVENRSGGASCRGMCYVSIVGKTQLKMKKLSKERKSSHYNPNWTK